MSELETIIAELEDAAKQLDPPFLGLPELDHTVESLAYRRGARDAYLKVIEVLRGVPSAKGAEDGG